MVYRQNKTVWLVDGSEQIDQLIIGQLCSMALWGITAQLSLPSLL